MEKSTYFVIKEYIIYIYILYILYIYILYIYIYEHVYVCQRTNVTIYHAYIICPKMFDANQGSSCCKNQDCIPDAYEHRSNTHTQEWKMTKRKCWC